MNNVMYRVYETSLLTGEIFRFCIPSWKESRIMKDVADGRKLMSEEWTLITETEDRNYARSLSNDAELL